MKQLLHKQHDHRTAHLMSRFADAAYDEPDQVAGFIYEMSKAEFAGLSFAVRSFDVPASGAQCFIAASSEFVVLSFRGTQPGQMEDLLTDARFVQVGGPYGSKHSRVHAGFWAALYSLLHFDQGFLEFLHDATRDNQPLYITGHSLGGALATLMAAFLSNGSWPGVAVYTFGSPRVGNRGFAALYDHLVPNTWRYVHDNDLYSRFPWQLGRFRHVGHLCYLNSEWNLQIDPPLWGYYWDRYRSLFGGLCDFARDSHYDHSVLKYVAATAAQLGDGS